MRTLKIVMFLYSFCSIINGAELSSVVADTFEIKDTISIQTQYFDSVTTELKQSEKEESISKYVNDNSSEDTCRNNRDTFYTISNQLDTKEKKDTIKVTPLIAPSNNVEDSLKIKYPHYYKNSMAVKIGAAIGSSAVIGGIISFIVIKQLKTSSTSKSEIPEPPLPPSY